MNSKIYFATLNELAMFLRAFPGSTATFEVCYDPRAARWVLTFLEGF